MRPHVDWSPAHTPSYVIRPKQASGILLIAMALLLLPGIAFASPPDPSWIEGIYDGADDDDIVTLITDNVTGDVLFPPRLPPPAQLAGTPFDVKPEAAQGLHGDHRTRGPPSDSDRHFHFRHILQVRTPLSTSSPTLDVVSLSDRLSTRPRTVAKDGPPPARLERYEADA
jgi:hypothetical protein